MRAWRYAPTPSALASSRPSAHSAQRMPCELLLSVARISLTDLPTAATLAFARSTTVFSHSQVCAAAAAAAAAVRLPRPRAQRRYCALISRLHLVEVLHDLPCESSVAALPAHTAAAAASCSRAPQTVVLCGSCSTVLCTPTGGRARLTEGADAARAVDVLARQRGAVSHWCHCHRTTTLV